jgi:hypothetical protein
VKLTQIGTLSLVYGPASGELGFDREGQLYGRLRGELVGEELSGSLDLTNTAQFRTDGVLTPTLRGLLTTPDGVRLYATLDGLSIPDEASGKNRRIVMTAMTLRTGDERYQRWNSILLLFEGRGAPTNDSWGIVGAVFRCEPSADDLRTLPEHNGTKPAPRRRRRA